MLRRQLWTFLFAVLLTATGFWFMPGLGIYRPASPSPAFTRQYAVKVLPGHSEGSGVVIGNVTYTVTGHPAIHSLILTCAHVLTDDFRTDAPPIVGIERDGVLYLGRVVASDTRADLSLIEVSEHWPAVRFYMGKVASGRPEITVGYPLESTASLALPMIGRRGAKAARRCGRATAGALSMSTLATGGGSLASPRRSLFLAT